MPVKKIKSEIDKKKKEVPVNNGGLFCCPRFSNYFAKKLIVTLFGILLMYLIVWVGTGIRNNLKEHYYIGQADKMERTIVISEVGKVTATPDIAMTTIGMITEGETVATAQTANHAVIEKLAKELKKLGVENNDLQTVNYNVNPLYDYTVEEGRVLRGYEVNQQMSVKIRNVDNANKVVALAGELGANSVSGLQFTVDDKDIYRAEARDKALEKVKEKAKSLAGSLGVGIVGIVSYDEYEVTPDAYDFNQTAYGKGGGGEVVQSGSMDVAIQVSVIFEIK